MGFGKKKIRTIPDSEIKEFAESVNNGFTALVTANNKLVDGMKAAEDRLAAIELRLADLEELAKGNMPKDRKESHVQ